MSSLKFSMVPKDGTHRAHSYHGAYSRTPLQIRGNWQFSGPQPVGQGGVPDFAAALFEENKRIQQVAMSTATGGWLYQRLPTDPNYEGKLELTFEEQEAKDRKEFETFYSGTRSYANFERYPSGEDSNYTGQYLHRPIQDAWVGWRGKCQHG